MVEGRGVKRTVAAHPGNWAFRRYGETLPYQAMFMLGTPKQKPRLDEPGFHFDALPP